MRPIKTMCQLTSQLWTVSCRQHRMTSCTSRCNPDRQQGTLRHKLSSAKPEIQGMNMKTRIKEMLWHRVQRSFVLTDFKPLEDDTTEVLFVSFKYQQLSSVCKVLPRRCAPSLIACESKVGCGVYSVSRAGEDLCGLIISPKADKETNT